MLLKTKINFTGVICSILVFGCSKDNVKYPPSDQTTPHVVPSHVEVLDEDDFRDPAKRKSLQTNPPQTPPKASSRGIWECSRGYNEIGLCSWRGVPDLIVLGYLRDAAHVKDYYKVIIGEDDFGEVEQCNSKANISYSLSLQIQVVVVLKNETEQSDISNIEVLIDSSNISNWEKEVILDKNIASNKNYILDGVLNKNQLIGLSVFEHNGTYSIGQTPIFILDPRTDELVFQEVDMCESLVPNGWEGIPVDEFLDSLRKCEDLEGQDTRVLRDSQFKLIEDPRYGKNLCY